jgi:hypothetical protein
MILQLFHNLAHEVDPEAARGSLVERGRELGLWSVKGIERNATIAEVHANRAISQFQANPDAVERAGASAMFHRVREQFFEDEVELELGIVAESMRGTELRDFAGQAR